MGTRNCSLLSRGLSALAVTTLLAGLTLAVAAPVSAATYNVTNTNASGAGSLRQALLDAATNPGPDTVSVQAALGTIEENDEIAWYGDDSVTILGNGVTVDFNGASRGLVDNGGNGVEIDSMTITGVTSSGGNDQAPVVSQGGDILVAKCTITGNDVTTDDGDVAGAILSEGGSVTINACTITGNKATGTYGDGAGAVLSEAGPVTVSNSTISGNTVTSDGDAGGGILSEGGNVIVTGSTINCNDASATEGDDAAGGILSEGGQVTIRTSTIVANTASAVDTGLFENSILSTGPAPVITESTVSDVGDCATPVTTTTAAPTTVAPTTTTAPAVAVAVQPTFTG